LGHRFLGPEVGEVAAAEHTGDPARPTRGAVA
jgi:hypothetical protein